MWVGHGWLIINDFMINVDPLTRILDQLFELRPIGVLSNIQSIDRKIIIIKQIDHIATLKRNHDMVDVRHFLSID